MPCGHEFSAEEVVMLIIQAAITSRSMQNSDMREIKPIMEIKELPPCNTNKIEHLTHDVTEI